MSRKLPLFVDDHPYGPLRVLRYVRPVDGERLVEAERATREYSSEESVIGYMLRQREGAPPKLRIGPGASATVVGSQRHESVRAISKAEVEANAGLRGRSQTAGLTEDQRVARIRKRWRGGEMEDFIERAKAKVDAYESAH